MKSGTQNHVKLKRLKKLLGIPLYRAVGILETLWLLCQDCCDDGNLGKFTDEEVAEYLEWDGDIRALFQALEDSRWIDLVDGRPVIHDWLEHCPEFIRERIRKRDARATRSEKRRELSTCDSAIPDSNGQSRTSAGPAAVCPVYSKPIPTQPNQTQPTNQSNSDRTAADGLAGGLVSVAWDQAGSRLAALGAARWKETLETARKCGCTPEHVNAVMDYAAARGYHVGAVCYRLQRANPNLPLEQGWPKLSPNVDPSDQWAKKCAANRKEGLAWEIVRAGKRAGKSEAEINNDLAAEGLPPQ